MAVNRLFLAIDCGTQSLRALVFDGRGTTIAKERVTFTPYHAEKPGWAEQDPDVYWRALCTACQKLWLEHDIDKQAIAGVAVTTQRGTVVNVDRAGKPLRPAILWLDQRTAEDQKPIGGIWGILFRVAGVRETIEQLQAAAESNWLRRHQPEIWRQTHKFLLLSGYLNYKLTHRFADSIACQVGYLPFDYKNLRWASAREWKWKALGIEPEMLCELEQPGTELGRITTEAAGETGLPLGLPVIAAAADKACEVLGSGGLSPEIGCLSYGTTATFDICCQNYVEGIPFIPPYPAAVPGAYNTEVQIFRGYWMVAWFKQQFGDREVAESARTGISAEKLLEKLLDEAPPGCDGLLVQPYWSPGIRIPGPEARGTMLGFTDVHTRAHIYRAILEGMAFAMREGKERVERRSKVKVTQLRASGGGSQSDAALQLTADIFGLPVARPHTYETSGLGAAMILAVADGLHDSYESAVREMCHTARIFEPNEQNRRLYDRLYREVYSKTYPRMKPLYKALRGIL